MNCSFHQFRENSLKFERLYKFVNILLFCSNILLIVCVFLHVNLMIFRKRNYVNNIPLFGHSQPVLWHQPTGFMRSEMIFKVTSECHSYFTVRELYFSHFTDVRFQKHVFLASHYGTDFWKSLLHVK